MLLHCVASSILFHPLPGKKLGSDVIIAIVVWREKLIKAPSEWKKNKKKTRLAFTPTH